MCEANDNVHNELSGIIVSDLLASTNPTAHSRAQIEAFVDKRVADMVRPIVMKSVSDEMEGSKWMESVEPLKDAEQEIERRTRMARQARARHEEETAELEEKLQSCNNALRAAQAKCEQETDFYEQETDSCRQKLQEQCEQHVRLVKALKCSHQETAKDSEAEAQRVILGLQRDLAEWKRIVDLLRTCAATTEDTEAEAGLAFETIMKILQQTRMSARAIADHILGAGVKVPMDPHILAKDPGFEEIARTFITAMQERPAARLIEACEDATPGSMDDGGRPIASRPTSAHVRDAQRDERRARRILQNAKYFRQTTCEWAEGRVVNRLLQNPAKKRGWGHLLRGSPKNLSFHVCFRLGISQENL